MIAGGTPTRLVVKSLTRARWEALGKQLGRNYVSSRWWLGDWLIAGQARHGVTYAQASKITGLSAGTLRNVVSVCRKVAPDRRRADVSWAHHIEVSSLDAAGQKKWLERSAREGLSRAQLRALAKGSHPGQRHMRVDAVARLILAAAVPLPGGGYHVARGDLAQLAQVLGEPLPAEDGQRRRPRWLRLIA